jgi:hypothetical protein
MGWLLDDLLRRDREPIIAKPHAHLANQSANPMVTAR